MRDEQIVTLYWQRDEAAIRETEQKYGKYLSKIAYGILADLEDSKESVHDTYLRAWNSMPCHHPSVLSTYLGKLVRRSSIDIFRWRNRDKRQVSEYAFSLSELEECSSHSDITQQSVDLHLLAETIDAFLHTLSLEARNIFVGRYYFMDSIREVAAYYDMSESKTTSLLHRIRLGLKAYLEQEGFQL